MIQWPEFICHVQSFCHTLGYSVQVLMFPVIGIERWHSIKTPFEMTANLQRVRILNGEISQILCITTLIKTFSWKEMLIWKTYCYSKSNYLYIDALKYNDICLVYTKSISWKTWKEMSIFYFFLYPNSIFVYSNRMLVDFWTIDCLSDGILFPFYFPVYLLQQN